MNIYDIEPLFSEETFIAKVNNIFILLYSSVMNKNLEKVDHFISDEVYKKYEQIIKELELKKYTQLYEQLNVKSTKIKNIEIGEEKIIVSVELISRSLDYVIDYSKRIVLGNVSERIENKHYLKFEKLRKTKEHNIVRRCPSCGANMNINSSGKCEYCDTIYDYENYDWILTSIK